MSIQQIMNENISAAKPMSPESKARTEVLLADRQIIRDIMFEYIEFYTKNLSNFAILLLIGAVIAILDITFRNVVKGVYLNVKDNIQKRHGITTGANDESSGREGMKNKDDTSDNGCPKDCNAVEALRTKLTGLIENASNLQKDIQENNETIKGQHRTIENMQKSIQKLTEKKK